MHEAVGIETQYPYTILTLSAVPDGGRGLTLSSAQAFWGKTDHSGGPAECWPWVGRRDRNGYGIGHFGWTRYAHRQAYYFSRGAYPRPHMDVCHSCDNPPCVNPNHLWLGTHSENLLDASQKGRLNTAAGERHSQSKLDWAKVRAIRARVAAGASQHRIAVEYGVSQVAIHFVVTRKTWANDPLEQGEEAA